MLTWDLSFFLAFCSGRRLWLRLSLKLSSTGEPDYKQTRHYLKLKIFNICDKNSRDVIYIKKLTLISSSVKVGGRNCISAG